MFIFLYFLQDCLQGVQGGALVFAFDLAAAGVAGGEQSVLVLCDFFPPGLGVDGGGEGAVFGFMAVGAGHAAGSNPTFGAIIFAEVAE